MHGQLRSGLRQVREHCADDRQSRAPGKIGCRRQTGLYLQRLQRRVLPNGGEDERIYRGRRYLPGGHLQTVFQRLPRKPAERLPGSPHHQSFALHGLPMYGRYGDYEHLTGDSGPFKGRTAHHISGSRVQAQGRYAGGGRQAGERASGR